MPDLDPDALASENANRRDNAGVGLFYSNLHRACDQVDQLIAEVKRLSEWRPIETAPVNESVLIYIPNCEHYGDGIYRGLQVSMGTGRRWSVTGLHQGRDCCSNQPTHWLPLPAAPVVKELEG